MKGKGNRGNKGWQYGAWMQSYLGQPLSAKDKALFRWRWTVGQQNQYESHISFSIEAPEDEDMSFVFHSSYTEATTPSVDGISAVMGFCWLSVVSFSIISHIEMDLQLCSKHIKSPIILNLSYNLPRNNPLLWILLSSIDPLQCHLVVFHSIFMTMLYIVQSCNHKYKLLKKRNKNGARNGRKNGKNWKK